MNDHLGENQNDQEMKKIDHELVRRCLNGDFKAMKELTDKYYGRIFSLCASSLPNLQMARDCTEEIFSKVADKIQTFRFKSSFLTWLFRIKNNTIINMLRKYNVKKRAQEEYSEYLDKRIKPLSILKSDFEWLLDLCLQELNDEDQFLIMQLYSGYDMSQIAEQLEIQKATAHKRYARAKEKMRNKLKEVCGESFTLDDIGA